MPQKLAKKFNTDIVPQIQEELDEDNQYDIPRLVKVVINVGVGNQATDADHIEFVTDQLAQITGQKPNIRRARQSISGFDVREGDPVGLALTLRGEKMFDFIDKLVSVALARVRDFDGLNPDSFDGQGNYTIGLKEHTVFPEVDYEEAEKVFGMEVTVVTSAEDDERARILLDALGFPFKKEE